MPEHTFILNGKRVSVDCADDVRLLWVLRDLLGVHGPKYGCGLGVCQACTSHINGKAFNPCSVPVSPDQARATRSPRSRGWPRPSASRCTRCSRRGWTYDVAQCGYCQPGQIMTAVAKIKQVKAEGRSDHRRRPRRDPQRLPLRHLPAHPRGDQGRRGEDVT